jgi:YcaO-like protein with predicted kinase domain
MLILADNTVNTEVPTYKCFLFDLIDPYYGITHGMGASLDPATAMIRAITEAVQARAVFHAGARDIFFHDQYMVYKAKNAERSIQVALHEAKNELDVSNIQSQATAQFEDDITMCLEKLKRVGIDQVIVFALTDPDADLCAVKVIVPGLEGYLHPYYKPGQRAKAYLHGINPVNHVH